MSAWHWVCGRVAAHGARYPVYLRRQDLKELKFRPSTDVHDYQVRLRAAQKFIAKVSPPLFPPCPPEPVLSYPLVVAPRNW